MSSAALSSAAVSRASETNATKRPSALRSTVAMPRGSVSRCRRVRRARSAHRVSGECIHIAQTTARSGQGITAPSAP